MNARITLKHQFVWSITEWLQEDLLVLAQEKIEYLETSYFKSILNKEDAEIHISMYIEKNSDELFEGKFHFNLDGSDIHYHNDVPFTEPKDVVSHAFKHVKEHLADAKK